MDIVEAPILGSLTTSSNELFDKVDEVIGRAVSVGDPLIALEYARGLQQEGIIRGLAVAKLLYRVKENWELFQVAGAGDDFESIVYSVNGYKASTIQKYLNVWESIFLSDELPKELKDRLAGRPISQLLLLAGAAREGSLSSEDWDKVSVASDKTEVRNIVRKARGEQTSSGTAVHLKVLTRDGVHPIGTIMAYQKNEQRVVGALDYENEDPLVKKAVAKIMNSAYIEPI